MIAPALRLCKFSPDGTRQLFAGGGIDRVAHLRRDEVWLAEQLSHPATRLVPTWRSRNLMVMDDAPGPVLLNANNAATIIENDSIIAFLGVIDEIAHFAIDLSHFDDPVNLPELRLDGEFVDLRNTGGLLDQQSGSLLAYARGLMHWHTHHRYCGVCGSPTTIIEAGHIQVCRNPDCKTQHFPRTDPAVIMLVLHDDSCLLGRASRFPTGMYSTLAGFVEPGESLEEAVAREVYEETGVTVTDVQYNSSQPWPFPASIMLGFHATATDRTLYIDQDELVDAGWYSREFLLNSPEDETFCMPRKLSIARRLVDDWLAEG